MGDEALDSGASFCRGVCMLGAFLFPLVLTCLTVGNRAPVLLGPAEFEIGKGREGPDNELCTLVLGGGVRAGLTTIKFIPWWRGSSKWRWYSKFFQLITKC